MDLCNVLDRDASGLVFVSCFPPSPRYNVKVDIDNHLRYTDEEYKQHLTVCLRRSPALSASFLLSLFIFVPTCYPAKNLVLQ